MPTITLTSANDTFTVRSAGTYDLDFLGGDDRLNAYGGDSITAHLGDGNDLAIINAGLDSVFGDAGNDRFDIYTSAATVDGGSDDDTINVRGGSGLSALGGDGNDRFNFYADTSSVTVRGGDRDDRFYGYYHSVAGDLYGGAGDDHFIQFVSGATMLGGAGNDIYRITVGSPATVVESVAEGTDSAQVARGFSYSLPDNVENLTVLGFSGSTTGSATLSGNGLDNAITGHDNVELISGYDGDDHLSGKGGDDTIFGGNGDDYVDGGTGADQLYGDAGNDTINGRAGADHMVGGTGNDVYYVDDQGDLITEFSGEGSDTIRITVSFYGLQSNVENGIQMGTADLSLSGNELDNHLIGNSGNSVLYGLAGNDTLVGGAGNDTLWGGDSDDILVAGVGDDTLYGENGNDSLDGGEGSDNMTGGAGDDVYYVDNSGDVVTENALEGTDTVYSSINYTLGANLENLTLTGGEGTGFGNELNNMIHGSDGANLLDGHGGADTVYGALGDDVVIVDDAADTAIEYAGEGLDTIYAWVSYTMPDNFENLNVLTGNVVATGNGLDNVMYGNNAPGIVLLGMGGNDRLIGYSDDDQLEGGDGNDVLLGAYGTDILDGGAGDDTLTGGALRDTLTGGSGNDVFVFQNDDFFWDVEGATTSTADHITDFTSGDDKIDLSQVDANSFVSGDQALTFVSTNAFTGTAGELRYEEIDGNTYVEADTNGDGIADYIIALDGSHALTGSDFML